MAYAVGVHLHAEVSSFGTVGFWPRSPVAAFRFSNRGMNGMMHAPRFFGQPRCDVFVIDLNVLRQASMKGGVDGQTRERRPVSIMRCERWDAPQSKAKVGQEVDPSERCFAHIADAIARRQASKVKANARSSHNQRWRASLQGSGVNPRCPCPCERLRLRGRLGPIVGSRRGSRAPRSVRWSRLHGGWLP